MTHPTQPDRDDASTPPDRETVARVIDPETWAAMEGRWEDDAFGRWLSDEHRAGCLGERQGYALAKADAILALFATPSSCVLVPLEATMPMLVAATSRDQGPDDSLYASIYRAMVQAALRGRGEGGAGEDQGAAGTPSAGGER